MHWTIKWLIILVTAMLIGGVASVANLTLWHVAAISSACAVAVLLLEWAMRIYVTRLVKQVIRSLDEEEG